jgi:hypothetical protein
MRLAELRPRWIKLTNWVSDELYAIGFQFDCPHCCHARGVHFKPHLDPHGLYAKYHWTFTPQQVSGNNPIWDRTGDTFDTLTISPSINFGPGHWHGHIINGELK